MNINFAFLLGTCALVVIDQLWMAIACVLLWLCFIWLEKKEVMSAGAAPDSGHSPTQNLLPPPALKPLP
jgi:hypothetical protein